MIQTHLVSSDVRVHPLDAAILLQEKLNTMLAGYYEQDVRRVEVHPHQIGGLTQYIAFVWINEEEPVEAYHGEEETAE